MNKNPEETKDPFIEAMANEPNYGLQTLHNHLSFLFVMALVGAPMYWLSTSSMDEGIRSESSRVEVLQNQ